MAAKSSRGLADVVAASPALGDTDGLPEVARSQGPMESPRTLVSLAGADGPDSESTWVPLAAR